MADEETPVSASASEGNVFGDSACDVPAVPPLPDYHVIDNGFVPEAPPDIVDCLEDLPPPLADEPPCPELTAETVSFSPFADSDAPVKAHVTVTKGECCDYVFDVDVDVPCVKLAAVNSNPENGYAYHTAKFTPYDTKLKTTIRRVTREIDPSKLVVETDDGPVQGTVDADDCSYEFDVELDMHCPTIKVAEDATIPFTDQATDLKPVVEQDGDCVTTINFEGGIHCSKIETDVTVEKLPAGSEPTAEIDVNTNADDCDYLFSLTLGIPEGAPCPTMDIGTLSITMLDEEDAPYFTGSFDEAGECGFLLNLAIGVPSGGGGGGGGGGRPIGSESGDCKVRPEDFIRCNVTTGKIEIVPGYLKVIRGVLCFIPDDPSSLQGGDIGGDDPGFFDAGGDFGGPF